VSTNHDRYILSWEEVAVIYNYRENTDLHPNTIKQAGLVALRKLRERFEDENIKLEDLVDL